MANNQTNRVPRIGDVYCVAFQGFGSEQTGLRPALVIQNNVGNRNSPNVVVVPLTSKVKRRDLPTHVFVPCDGTGLKRDSVVLCENPTSVSKDRLGTYLTTLPDPYMADVAEASLLASSVVAFLDADRLERTRRRAERLVFAAAEQEGAYV